jgi:hypothetical protein
MVPAIALNDGTTIPQLGFGTLQIPESRRPSASEIDAAAGVFGAAFAMRSIDDMDKGEAGRVGPHPDTFDWIPSPQTPDPR